VHNNFWCEVEENIFEETDCESEACPIVSVLENLKSVTIEVNISIEVHVVEGFHRDLVLSAVLQLVLILLEGKVVLNWASWEFGFFISAG
jgi:hypothetical protein